LLIDTVNMDAMKLELDIMDMYRAEARKAGIEAAGLLSAGDYGAFLSAHLGHLVGRRYLRREWPVELAHAVTKLDLFDLAVLAVTDKLPITGGLAESIRMQRDAPGITDAITARAVARGLDPTSLSSIPVMTFLGDWYRVKMGSDLGLDAIVPANLEAYRFLSGLYAEGKWEDGTAQAAFGRLWRMFDRFISGLPSRNFSIELATGDVEAQ
jgi:hypothetical protein